MRYDQVTGILNHHIFEGGRRSLIEKLASNPERYIGEFRPTKPRTKLVQNLLQSHEIRFGGALEYLLREILAELGFSNLDRNINIVDNKTLSIDQYFSKGKEHYFVEQKIRDDHDSTKKQGQIENFKAKLDFLFDRHQTNLIGIMYFVDPSFSKNKKFYMRELTKLQEKYQVELFLFYGQDFFTFLNYSKIWKELVGWLRRWKTNLEDFPVIDLDISPAESLEEMQSIRPHYWQKLIANEKIWEDGIIQVLFSDGATLRLLFGFFSQQQTTEYQNLAESLLDRINTYYY